MRRTSCAPQQMSTPWISIVLPDPPLNALILCTSEVTCRNQRCRIDTRWSTHNKTVAILEFKNIKVLNKDGNKLNARMRKRWQSRYIAQGKAACKPVLLEGNAVAVSKQAAKYSSVCKVIALFDWNSMMIYDFYDAHENALPAKPARGIFFEE